ncbi:MAG: RNase adapter RapZ [Eggerthella lenta]
MHSFEDLGYFCVDNLPSSLIGNLLELKACPASPTRSAASPWCATRATATSSRASPASSRS